MIDTQELIVRAQLMDVPTLLDWGRQYDRWGSRLVELTHWNAAGIGFIIRTARSPRCVKMAARAIDDLAATLRLSIRPNGSYVSSPFTSIVRHFTAWLPLELDHGTDHARSAWLVVQHLPLLIAELEASDVERIAG